MTAERSVGSRYEATEPSTIPAASGAKIDITAAGGTAVGVGRIAGALGVATLPMSSASDDARSGAASAAVAEPEGCGIVRQGALPQQAVGDRQSARADEWEVLSGATQAPQHASAFEKVYRLAARPSAVDNVTPTTHGGKHPNPAGRRSGRGEERGSDRSPHPRPTGARCRKDWEPCPGWENAECPGHTWTPRLDPETAPAPACCPRGQTRRARAMRRRGRRPKYCLPSRRRWAPTIAQIDVVEKDKVSVGQNPRHKFGAEPRTRSMLDATS